MWKRSSIYMLLFFLVTTCLLLILLQFRQVFSQHAVSGQIDLTSLVNPFIGTAHGIGGSDSGDTFPGAVYPMGMVQWSPDTTTSQPGGYYYPDNTIKGFSVTHFSGRGCNVYENFPFTPSVGAVTAAPGSGRYSTFSHANEVAKPGYYKVLLNKWNVTVELSATARTGIAQFTYPSTNQAALFIHAGDDLNTTKATNAQISVVGNNRVTGSATANVGCGSQQYTIYFSTQFDRPFTS